MFEKVITAIIVIGVIWSLWKLWSDHKNLSDKFDEKLRKLGDRLDGVNDGQFDAKGAVDKLRTEVKEEIGKISEKIPKPRSRTTKPKE